MPFGCALCAQLREKNLCHGQNKAKLRQHCFDRCLTRFCFEKSEKSPLVEPPDKFSPASARDLVAPRKSFPTRGGVVCLEILTCLYTTVLPAKIKNGISAYFLLKAFPEGISLGWSSRTDRCGLVGLVRITGLARAVRRDADRLSFAGNKGTIESTQTWQHTSSSEGSCYYSSFLVTGKTLQSCTAANKILAMIRDQCNSNAKSNVESRPTLNLRIPVPFPASEQWKDWHAFLCPVVQTFRLGKKVFWTQCTRDMNLRHLAHHLQGQDNSYTWMWLTLVAFQALRIAHALQFTALFVRNPGLKFRKMALLMSYPFACIKETPRKYFEQPWCQKKSREICFQNTRHSSRHTVGLNFWPHKVQIGPSPKKVENFSTTIIGVTIFFGWLLRGVVLGANIMMPQNNCMFVPQNRPSWT